MAGLALADADVIELKRPPGNGVVAVLALTGEVLRVNERRVERVGMDAIGRAVLEIVLMAVGANSGCPFIHAIFMTVSAGKLCMTICERKCGVLDIGGEEGHGQGADECGQARRRWQLGSNGCGRAE